MRIGWVVLLRDGQPTQAAHLAELPNANYAGQTACGQTIGVNGHKDWAFADKAFLDEEPMTCLDCGAMTIAEAREYLL